MYAAMFKLQVIVFKEFISYNYASNINMKFPKKEQINFV